MKMFKYISVATGLLITGCTAKGSKTVSDTGRAEETEQECESTQVARGYVDIIDADPFMTFLPSSVYTDDVPTNNFVAVYIDKNGHVVLKIFGDGSEGAAGDEAIRKAVLESVARLYYEQNGIDIPVTPEKLEHFAKTGMVGAPLRIVGTEAGDKLPGIPYEMDVYNPKGETDLRLWIQAIRKVARAHSVDLCTNLNSTCKGWIIVADGGMDFMRLQKIFDNFQWAGVYKVSILTGEMAVTMDSYGICDGVETNNNRHYVTPLVLYGSNRTPAIVEDYDYIDDDYSYATAAGWPEKECDFIPEISFDEGEDYVEDYNEVDAESLDDEIIEEPLPEEELIDIEELEVKSIFDVQIPSSRALEWNLWGQYPLDSHGYVKNVATGEFSDKTSLVGEDLSDNSCLAYFRQYQNYPEYANVLIRANDVSTLSTVMAAVSVMKIYGIDSYYVVTGFDDSFATGKEYSVARQVEW